MKKLISSIIVCFLIAWYWNLYQSEKHLWRACEYLRLQDGNKAIKELEKSVKKNVPQILGRYYLAILYEMQGKPIQALYLYQDLKGKAPNFILSSYHLYFLFLKLGQKREAYNSIVKAEKLYPLDEVIRKEKSKFIVR